MNKGVCDLGMKHRQGVTNSKEKGGKKEAVRMKKKKKDKKFRNRVHMSFTQKKLTPNSRSKLNNTRNKTKDEEGKYRVNTESESTTMHKGP